MMMRKYSQGGRPAMADAPRTSYVIALKPPKKRLMARRALDQDTRKTRAKIL